MWNSCSVKILSVPLLQEKQFSDKKLLHEKTESAELERVNSLRLNLLKGGTTK